MAHQCWTCGNYSSSKKMLKNHAAAEHKHLAVICIYCRPKEVTLGRINDLKKHISTKHPSISIGLPDNFFSEGNGFYLSLHPYDYVKHVKPTPMDSTQAKQAMLAVRTLISSLSNSTKSLPQWETGWLQAIGTPIRDTVPSTKPVYKSNLATVLSRPSSLTSLLSPLPEFTATKLSPSKPVSAVMPPPTSPLYSPPDRTSRLVALYSPSRPEISQPPEEIIYLNKKERRCLFKYDNDLFIAQLNQSPTKIADISNDNPDLYTLHATGILGAEYYEPCQMLAQYLCVTAFEIGTISKISGLVVKAVEQLRFGAMPLTCPAPRDWSKVSTPVKLTNSVTKATLRWPPVNWQTKDPQTKRLNFTAAVMKLDEGIDGMPKTNVDLIYDTYNYLLLPGSAPIQQTSESAKRRFLNYKVLINFVTKNHDRELASMLISNKLGNSEHLQKIRSVPLRILKQQTKQ